MATIIHFRPNCGTPVTVEWPRLVKTEPGWVKVFEHMHDPDFGDGGIEWDAEREAYPSETVSRVLF